MYRVFNVYIFDNEIRVEGLPWRVGVKGGF